MNKNRFDGLRFRIMEALEKAKGVPLTAREVAVRLHEDEYKDQMFDTINFRVTNAIHAMKGKGQVVQHDARGEGGALTYVLPQRMAFSQKKDDTPPANPVLKPEVAEKIVTKEPEPEKEPKRPIYAPGLVDKIVEFLDQAPYPQALPEIVDALGHEYGGHYEKRDLVTVFAGHMHGLFKANKIKRVSSSGRVRKVQYEYFTKKTKMKVYVPPVTKPNSKPNSKPRKTETQRHQEIVDEQFEAAHKPLFRPGARPTKDTEFKIRIAQSMYDDWKADAQRFGVNISQFVIDAVEFARGYAGEE